MPEAELGTVGKMTVPQQLLATAHLWDKHFTQPEEVPHT